jgi:hypothetical protein
MTKSISCSFDCQNAICSGISFPAMTALRQQKVLVARIITGHVPDAVTGDFPQASYH